MDTSDGAFVFSSTWRQVLWLRSLTRRFLKACVPVRRSSVSWGCCGPLFDLEVFLVSYPAARLALTQPPSFSTLFSWSLELHCSARGGSSCGTGRQSAKRIPTVYCCCPARPRDGGFCLSVVSSSVSHSLALSLLFFFFVASLISFYLCYTLHLCLSPSLFVAAISSGATTLSVTLLLNKWILLLNELQFAR